MAENTRSGFFNSPLPADLRRRRRENFMNQAMAAGQGGGGAKLGSGLATLATGLMGGPQDTEQIKRAQNMKEAKNEISQKIPGGVHGALDAPDEGTKQKRIKIIQDTLGKYGLENERQRVPIELAQAEKAQMGPEARRANIEHTKAQTAAAKREMERDVISPLDEPYGQPRTMVKRGKQGVEKQTVTTPRQAQKWSGEGFYMPGEGGQKTAPLKEPYDEPIRMQKETDKGLVEETAVTPLDAQRLSKQGYRSPGKQPDIPSQEGELLIDKETGGKKRAIPGTREYQSAVNKGRFVPFKSIPVQKTMAEGGTPVGNIGGLEPGERGQVSYRQLPNGELMPAGVDLREQGKKARRSPELGDLEERKNTAKAVKRMGDDVVKLAGLEETGVSGALGQTLSAVAEDVKGLAKMGGMEGLDQDVKNAATLSWPELEQAERTAVLKTSLRNLVVAGAKAWSGGDDVDRQTMEQFKHVMGIEGDMMAKADPSQRQAKVGAVVREIIRGTNDDIKQYNKSSQIQESEKLDPVDMGKWEQGSGTPDSETGGTTFNNPQEIRNAGTEELANVSEEERESWGPEMRDAYRKRGKELLGESE